MMTWLATEKDALAGLASLTTAVSLAVAVTAGIFAFWKFNAERKFQLRLRARDSYLEYLKYSIDLPQYYISYWSNNELSYEDKVRYHGFVAYMLTSLEEVLELDPGTDWEGAVAADLAYHRDYLARPEFEKYLSTYSPPLQAVIRSVVNDSLTIGQRKNA